MTIAALIARRGPVVTIDPGQTVRSLLDLLAEKGIGCAVVSPDGEHVAGIVSERDVVRQLASSGAGLLASKVSDIMTTDVLTVDTEASYESLMRLMTDNRVRHIPVVTDGRLVGLVSIGDVVKERIDSLEDERAALVSYITQGG